MTKIRKVDLPIQMPCYVTKHGDLLMININSNLSQEKQQEAYDRALEHISTGFVFTQQDIDDLYSSIMN